MLALVVWLFWLQVDAEWENVDLLRPVHRCPRGHAVMNWGFRTCSIMPRPKDHSLLGRSFSYSFSCFVAVESCWGCPVM